MTCPLCASSDTVHHEDVKTKDATTQYTMYRCRSCTLVFADPMKAISQDWYEQEIWDSYYKDKWEFHELFKRLKPEPMEILEIACGEGYFLNIAQQLGHRVVGIDFSKPAIETAKAKFGISETYPWTVEEYREHFPDRKFDLVCFFHLIEHVENPKEFISNLGSVLKEKGLIAFSTPNPQRVDLHYFPRQEWDYPPHHLTRWEKRSIETLLQIVHYKPIAIEEEPLNQEAILEMLMMKTSLGIMGNIRQNETRTHAQSTNSPESSSTTHKVLQLLVKLKQIALSPFAAVQTARRKREGYSGHSFLVIAEKVSR